MLIGLFGLGLFGFGLGLYGFSFWSSVFLPTPKPRQRRASMELWFFVCSSDAGVATLDGNSQQPT
jgi:hypothetical protein